MRYIYKAILFFLLFSCVQKNKKQNIGELSVSNSSTNDSTLTNDKGIRKSKYCDLLNSTCELGMGVAKPIVDTQGDYSIKLYNDSNLNFIYSDFLLYQDGSDKNFCSKMFKPDYGIMYFIILDTIDSIGKIIINECEIKYVNLKKDFQIVRWLNFFKSVDLFFSKEMEVFSDTTCEYSEKVNVSIDTEIRVLGINDDLLKIGVNGKQGWIKWRDKNRILLEWFYK